MIPFFSARAVFTAVAPFFVLLMNEREKKEKLSWKLSNQ